MNEYYGVIILPPHSASSSRPLRSLSRLDVLDPRSITALAQSRSFASIAWSHSLECTFPYCTLYFSFWHSFVFLCLSQNLFYLMGPCTRAALLNGSSH